MKKYTSILDLSPELVQIWEVAGQKKPSFDDPMIVETSSKREAVSLRQRLYQVRKKLIKEGYPSSVSFNKLEIAMEEGSNRLLIRMPRWLAAVQTTLKKEGVEPMTDDELENTRQLMEAAETSAQTEALKNLFPPEKH